MAATEGRVGSIRTLRAFPGRAGLVAVGPVLMAVLFAGHAQALDWRLTRTLEGSATYTDNANHSDSDPEDALILRATPGFTLQSTGSRRVQATVQYGLSGVTRFGERDSTDFYHRLNAAGNAELVENFLFLDASARISQELISLEGPLTEAEIDDSNRANVGTYMVSPHIQKRLGSFANAQARYTTSGAIFSDRANTSNVESNAFTAALTSGTRFNDLSWGLHYSIREVNNRDDADATFEQAYASLGYVLTRKFRVFGTVGEEWNEYLSTTDTDGSSWSAGFGWAPSRRTSIEASTGERFFGKTYSLSVRHRTRASNWNVSYVDDVSDISQFIFTSGTVYDYLCPGPDGGLVFYPGWPFTVPPAPGCIAFGGTPGLVFDLRNGVFVSRAARAGVSWGIGKLNYSLNAFDSRRDYQLLDAEDRTRGVTFDVDYRFAPNTSVTGGLSGIRYEVPAALSTRRVDREDDVYRISLGVNHQFATDLSGALTYLHQRRDSSDTGFDFTENRITATGSLTF